MGNFTHFKVRNTLEHVYNALTSVVVVYSHSYQFGIVMDLSSDLKLDLHGMHSPLSLGGGYKSLNFKKRWGL